MGRCKCFTLHFSSFNNLSSDGFGLVATAIATLRQGFQLALDELFAKGRDAVDKHVSLQMVELVLHDAGQIALHPLIVGLELLIEPLHTDARRPNYLLVDGRKRQTAFFTAVGLAVVSLNDMGIDIDTTEVLVLWHVIAENIQVDDDQTDGLAYLRCCQSNALAVGQCVPHVSYQFLQLRIVGRDILGYFP